MPAPVQATRGIVTTVLHIIPHTQTLHAGKTCQYGVRSRCARQGTIPRSGRPCGCQRGLCATCAIRWPIAAEESARPGQRHHVHGRWHRLLSHWPHLLPALLVRPGEWDIAETNMLYGRPSAGKVRDWQAGRQGLDARPASNNARVHGCIEAGHGSGNAAVHVSRA